MIDAVWIRLRKPVPWRGVPVPQGAVHRDGWLHPGPPFPVDPGSLDRFHYHAEIVELPEAGTRPRAVPPGSHEERVAVGAGLLAFEAALGQVADPWTEPVMGPIAQALAAFPVEWDRRRADLDDRRRRRLEAAGALPEWSDEEREHPGMEVGEAIELPADGVMRTVDMETGEVDPPLPADQEPEEGEEPVNQKPGSLSAKVTDKQPFKGKAQDKRAPRGKGNVKG